MNRRGARGLLLVGALRPAIGGDNQIVGGGIPIDERDELAARAQDCVPRGVERLRSSGAPVFVLGSAATIASSEAPSAPVSAAADPPPGVGSGEENASSTALNGLSASIGRLYHAPLTTAPRLNTA